MNIDFYVASFLMPTNHPECANSLFYIAIWLSLLLFLLQFFSLFLPISSVVQIYIRYNLHACKRTSHNKLIAEICARSVWADAGLHARACVSFLLRVHVTNDDVSVYGDKSIQRQRWWWWRRTGQFGHAKYKQQRLWLRHMFIKFMRFKMNFECNENVNDM